MDGLQRPGLKMPALVVQQTWKGNFKGYSNGLLNPRRTVTEFCCCCLPIQQRPKDTTPSSLATIIERGREESDARQLVTAVAPRRLDNGHGPATQRCTPWTRALQPSNQDSRQLDSLVLS